MKIKDGTGSAREARVDKNNRLEVKASSEPVFQNISDVEEESFSFNSAFTTAGANEEVIYIKNIHTEKHLHIQSIVVKSSVNTDWDLFHVTAGTATGTPITGKNLNLSSGNTAQVTALGDAEVTGGLTGAIIGYESSLANESVIFEELEGALIVSANDAIAITASAAGNVRATIYGFYEEID